VPSPWRVRHRGATPATRIRRWEEEGGGGGRGGEEEEEQEREEEEEADPEAEEAGRWATT